MLAPNSVYSVNDKGVQLPYRMQYSSQGLRIFDVINFASLSMNYSFYDSKTQLTFLKKSFYESYIHTRNTDYLKRKWIPSDLVEGKLLIPLEGFDAYKRQSSSFSLLLYHHQYLQTQYDIHISAKLHNNRLVAVKLRYIRPNILCRVHW